MWFTPEAVGLKMTRCTESLLENIMFLELQRRGYRVFAGIREITRSISSLEKVRIWCMSKCLFLWKPKKQGNVNFAVKRQSKATPQNMY